MRAVGYARVSSASQRERDTIASQLRVLPAFIESRGWQLARPIATYVDDGRTAKAGHLDARRGLAQLLVDAAAGVFDVVVVVDIDRLTRSEDLTERGAILGALQRAGVKVASASSGQVLDLSTSIGDLFGSLQAFFAAEENRKRRERIVQGKITAIQRGRKPSGPTPYGLAYERATGAWSVHPEQGPIVAEIFARVIAGESCLAIAEDLDRRGVPPARLGWTRHGVWQILRKRYALGEWTVDKRKRLTMEVPPIVSEATWQQAQEALLRHGKRGLRRTRHLYLLEGIAVCGSCGEPIAIRSGVTSWRGTRNPAAYVCKGRKYEARGRTRCSALILPVADADARAWAALGRELADPALAEYVGAELERRANTGPGPWEEDVRAARRHLDKLERVETALLARFRKELIDEAALDTELAAIRRERSAARLQLETATRAVSAAAGESARYEGARARLEAITAHLPAATPEDRRALIVDLVPRGSVVFTGRDISITAFLPLEEAASRDVAGAVALVPPVGCSTHHESHLRIRMVA